MVKRCLESCLTQSYPNLQIVVVDNKSTDGSIQIVHELAATSRLPIEIVSCETQGANHARRHGLTRARGQYVQWLDADDEILPQKIARQVDALEADPNAMIAYGDWFWRFYRDGRLKNQVFFRSTQFDDYLMQLLIGNWRPPVTFLLRRAAADQLASLDAWHPTTTAETDREYFSLAAATGMRFIYADDAPSIYNQWSGQQMTRSTTIAARAANVAKIFDRTRAHITSVDRLDAKHHRLLNQSWELWRPAPLSLQRKGEAVYAVLDCDRSDPVELTQPQAKVLAAIQSIPHAYFLELYARQVCQHLWRRVSWKHQDPNGAVDFEAASQAMAALLRTESDEDMNLTMIPDPRIEGEPTRVASFLSHGPLYVPLFARLRYRVLELLEQLCEKNLLFTAPPSDHSSTLPPGSSDVK